MTGKMKKTILFAMMAAVLGFTACSKEEPVQPETAQKKGMVLHATVAQPEDTKATFTDNEGVWHFDFAEGDQIMVTNKIISTEYTFTYNGTDFISTDAEPTSEPTRWYAYYPSKEMSLVGQTGKWEDLAKTYALIGSTFNTTGDVTGEEGLTITMSPAKLAFLKIENKKGSVDINVKDGADSWVKGLKVEGTSFTPISLLTKQTLLSTTEKGTYYIAVPAGKQLSIKDGDEVIKSTGTSGLQAGKYYELAILGQTKGVAKRTGDIDVNWVQLWEDGPKFAEYNVGAANNNPWDYGGYYCWGGNVSKDGTYYEYDRELTGKYDTATNLWGDKWRMPSKDEIENLHIKCECTWIEQNNVYGTLFTGKDAYSSNSLFLPAAGFYDTQYKEVTNDGKNGDYWSSTPELKTEFAYYLLFTTKNQYDSSYSRYQCLSVRAVYVGE